MNSFSLKRAWWFTLFLKLLLAAFLPLSTDESYYWVWGRHLQLSYFDHPPVVSWLFALGQFFDFFESASRWPGVILGHFTIFVWLKVGSRILNPEQLKWFFIYLVCMPFLGPGSLIVTPDIPVLFFWAVSTLFFMKAFESGRWLDFIFLGLSLGMGFSSKYHIVLFGFFGLLWLAASKNFRPAHIPRISLAVVAFLVTSSPVWVWNMLNDFISFRFQLGHGLGEKNWEPIWTGEYILAQLVIISPSVLYFAFRARLKTWNSFFHFISWGPLAFFLLTSFKGNTEANWPIVAYPSLGLLAVGASEKFKWLKTTSIVWVTVFALVLTQAAWSWFPIPPDKIKTHELVKYTDMVELVRGKEPLFAKSYQMASKLSFKLKRPVYKLKGLSRIDFYDFRNEASPEVDYFVINDIGAALPLWATEAGHIVSTRTTLNDKYELLEVKVRP